MASHQNLPGLRLGQEAAGLVSEPCGWLRLRVGDNRWELTADGVAYTAAWDLLAASLIGSSTEVKAWRAALNADAGTSKGLSLHWRAVGGHQNVWTLDEDGYACHTLKLGESLWHLVLLSRRPEFLPCVDEEGVWTYLEKATTTPLQRHWMGWLMDALKERGHLTDVPSLGYCNCGLVNVTNRQLDELVQAGLYRREIQIVA
jgi:hypothetical protein